jgi:hypothetical protein
MEKIKMNKKEKERFKKIAIDQLDMKIYKMEYCLSHHQYVEGLWKTLNRYGIEFSKEKHKFLVEIVENILTDDSDFEYEWSEAMYVNFVKFEI